MEKIKLYRFTRRSYSENEIIYFPPLLYNINGFRNYPKSSGSASNYLVNSFDYIKYPNRKSFFIDRDSAIVALSGSGYFENMFLAEIELPLDFVLDFFGVAIYERYFHLECAIPVELLAKHYNLQTSLDYTSKDYLDNLKILNDEMQFLLTSVPYREIVNIREKFFNNVSSSACAEIIAERLDLFSVGLAMYDKRKDDLSKRSRIGDDLSISINSRITKDEWRQLLIDNGYVIDANKQNDTFLD